MTPPFLSVNPRRFISFFLSVASWSAALVFGQDVKLSPSTAPAAGQPGVTSLNLAGSQYPGGSISPNQVQITITPVTGAAGSSVTFSPTAVITLLGSTRRLQFTIPSSIHVSAPTSYSVSVSGQTAAGVSFSSTNMAALTVNPPAQIISPSPNSGSPGQSLTVTVKGSFTNFTQGSTVATFGPGISVGGASSGGAGPVTVIDQETAIAQLSISSDVTPNSRNVSLQTGGEVATLANGFTVILCQALTPNWMRLSQSGTLPSTRQQHTVVYDPTSKRLITFGGWDFRTGVLNNETWVLTNLVGATGASAWNLVSVTGQLPPPRRGHSAAYDPNSNRMIIFGGNGLDSELNDVWVLKNANGLGGSATWQQLTPSGALPASRRFAQAAYDPSSNRLVLFGGEVSATTRVNDVWVLLNANGLGGTPTWTQLSPAGVPPSPRAFFYANLDTSNNRLIVFGGGDVLNGVSDSPSLFRNDVFVLTNANGLGGTPTWSSVVSEDAPGSPSPRLAMDGTSASIYVPSTNQFVVFGGQIGMCSESIVTCPEASISPDIWMLNNANGVSGVPTWKKLAISGGPQRTGTNVAYDSVTNTAFVYGGGFESVLIDKTSYADTWSVTNPIGTACSGAPPSLVSLSPNSGQQGQQNLSVAITGENTNFVQGKTAVSFGNGVTVISLMVNSPTSVVATISIPLTAPSGGRDVTVTTGTETATLIGGFAVSAPIPTNKPPVVTVGSDKLLSISSGSGSISEFLIPTASSYPWGITPDPSGNVWFTEHRTDKIGKITPTGQITEFQVPTANSASGEIALGPDGNFWFTEYFGQKIGRITPSGVVTEFIPPTAGYPTGITTGPDGNMWFTERLGDKIGRISLTGAITEFNVPTKNSNLSEIALGPDGNLWFTESGAANGIFFGVQKIGRITTSGVVTEFPVPTPNSQPYGIAAGPDGNMWFTELSAAQIGRITTDGVITEFPMPDRSDDPLMITQGLDGKLWFTEIQGNKIGSISTSGEIAEFPVPTGTSSPYGITFSPDCGLWFTEGTGVKISRADISMFYTPFKFDVDGSITDDGLPTGSSLTTSWSQQTKSCPASFSAPTTILPNVPGQSSPVSSTVTVRAPGSYAFKLTGSDSELSSNSTLKVTVNISSTAATPAILSASPNSGLQGQQKFLVTVVGQNTHFAENSTIANFGTGVTVEHLAVNSATTLTVALSILPTADIGPRDIIISTGTENVSLIGGFWVISSQSINQTPVVTVASDQTVAMSTGQGGLKEFPIPTTGSNLWGITSGPDGNMWFVEHVGNKIGRLTPSGVVTEYPIPTAGSASSEITTGADGNLWFTEYFGQKIGRITTTGLITEFPLPGAGYPVGITAGPDGNVWFVERLGNRIGRITPLGTITEFPIPSGGSNVVWIAVGPDGNLWFTESGVANTSYFGVEKIGRITLDGVISEFAVPTVASAPYAIASGADGNLWFTETKANKVGRITPTGVITEFPVPNIPYIITGGADGNLWFTEQDGNNIGQITPVGVVTEFAVPTNGSSPGGITLGPDCNIWFTENLSDKIGKADMAIFYNPVTVNFAGSVEDDGLPLAASLAVSWTQKSGSCPATFSNPTSSLPNVAGQINPVSTLATFRVPGSYIINLSGSDSQLTGNASLKVTVNPPPVVTGPFILSVSPNGGLQGEQSLSVTITAQNTHFIQGTTTATFGAGISVASVAVASATSLTAILNVASSALPGASDITVSTGAEVVILSKGFTIQAAPSVTTISPNYGPQGLSGPIAIVGQNTHFQQGVTTLDFGSDITVSNINVACLTCLTATLSVSPTATPGLRSFTVTTGTEVVTDVNGFNVIANGNSPILTAINPAGGLHGQSLTIAITGRNTHWAPGTTTVGFGAGITTTSVTVTSATALAAQISIDTAAVIGLRSVTVTTGSEVASVNNVFNVQAGATPIIYSLNPGGGVQGQSGLSVTITGQNTHWAQGTTTASFGAGVTVTSLTIASATSATAIVTIDAAAAPGTRTVTLSTGSEVANFANSFTISAVGPIVSSLNPGGTSQGALNFQVAITGQNTHWVQGSTVANFGSGITVYSLTVTSSTSATAVINVDASATVGPRTVALTTGTEVASFANGFSIVAGVIGITEINPGGGPQGAQNLSLAITAQFTHWSQGQTTATFGTGVTLVSLTITSATTATAVVSVDSSAALGARDVTFTTGTEVVTAPGGFTVSAGVSVLSQINPPSGQDGQQNLSVTITGQNTHFAQGATQVFFGANIAINSVTVNSPTILTAVISISPTAATGARKVAVQTIQNTLNEVISLPTGFTVTALPTILTSVVPNTAPQGQQNLAVTVTGQNTHFLQGSTAANFGAGITVVALAVNSPTSFTAILNVDLAASPGGRILTVTTNSEVVSLSSGFTVLASAPSPITVTPGSAFQGQTLTVGLTGQGTNWLQGTTKARFGPGVIVGGGVAGGFGPVTVTSPTTASAQITILNSAAPAPRTLTLKTGSQTDSGPNSFTVLGLPYLLSASPDHASQGDTVDVTVNGAYTHFVQGITKVNFGPGISVNGGPIGGAGTVAVNSPTSFTATLVIDPAAVLGLRTITAVTGSETASTSVNFSVLGVISGAGPQVTITSPSEGQDVTAPTTVTGTAVSANLDYWKLEYQAISSKSFVQFATGTASTVTGSFDPTNLLNGMTAIRLTAVDTSGQTTAVTVNVVVSRNLKIGNFTVSFNDLSVPVAGIPIQVIRTYDSRFKANADFGYGWRLGLNTVQLAENIGLGTQWAEVSSGGLIPTYCVGPTGTHTITVSLNDGTTYKFQPTLFGNCQQIVPPSQVTVGFAPIGITPPNASLKIAGSNLANIDGGPTGNVNLLGEDFALLDPDGYILTLPDGRQLQLSMQAGLQKMTDLNGNTLTITSAGITSSTGKSVTFTRDSQNRITQVTDPNNNVLSYNYDSAGDLASSTDASKNTSSYTYDGNHDLLTILDPSGAQPIRNDYDANGVLVSHTDAYGNVINYMNDPGTNQESVTDRDGNLTVNEYDSAGNIIKVTDALGGVTKRTYDANGNVLTETNALGNTRTYAYDSNNNRISDSDPLGHVAKYTFNSLNQVLTTTDANNHTATNVYDSNGNLLTTTDGAGNVNTYTYNSAGLRTSMKDPLGNVTSYQYDGSGDLTQQTDALNHVTTYNYDGNGNKLSQTQTRTTSSGQQTLTTGYQYDASNRVIQTTYADGSTTQIQYNSIGKQAATIDQLGHQTSYSYDLMGRLLQTTYPDTTTESSTYDPNGNRITSVDRAGRTTSYIYDPLNRLAKTVYADQSSTTTGYDATGAVTSVADGLGNVTQYQYDAAGQRTKTIDALSHATAFAYDAVGNQASVTDANSNTTQYQYDNLNRRTKTIYPDSTTDQVQYDALGRTTAKTDEANLTTQYSFDALGRLIQVTDALSQNTKYGYDEVGNRISQTDANNHTTNFAYDQLGRRIQRTLPAGQSESFTYDASGNQKTHTDFNGKTTNYTYDVGNRLTSKIPDASFSAPTVTFTYTATSQRLSMSDASGATNYQYNLRDRLTKKQTPEGTLSYTYDAAGNLLTIQSSNTGGTNVSYQYDADNRLSKVIDNRLASGTTTYSYDNVGNLSGYAYPNGVQTTYTYNQLNRLTNMAIVNATSSTLASYAYQLGLAGNRTQVTELSGRQVNYGYDNLYRLTSETIGNDPNGINGAIGYQYDSVGNRLQRTSTVGPVPTASYSYDADDRLASDTYDANGSTTASGGNSYAYDFENHLMSKNGGQVAIIYDGDGNRVSETENGVTTQYLLDDSNPTGYAQVLEELSGGAVQRTYTYGLSRVSQRQAAGTGFYGYDGHGSVRQLTDTTGAVTDRYDYEAFGKVISQMGATPNVYLYSGEQSDPNLGFYYLRARFYRAADGRFLTGDSFEGVANDTLSQHRYLYAALDPVNRLDPTGRVSIAELSTTVTILTVLSKIAFDVSFGANALAIEVNLYEPAFAARNGAIIAISSTDKPEEIAYALDIYQKANLLIQVASLDIRIAYQINRASKALIDLGVSICKSALADNVYQTIAGQIKTGTSATTFLNNLTGAYLSLRQLSNTVTGHPSSIPRIEVDTATAVVTQALNLAADLISKLK